VPCIFGRKAIAYVEGFAENDHRKLGGVHPTQMHPEVRMLLARLVDGGVSVKVLAEALGKERSSIYKAAELGRREKEKRDARKD